MSTLRNTTDAAEKGAATQGSTMKSMMESAAGTIQQGIGSLTGNEETKAKGAAKKAAAQNEKAASQYAKDAAQQQRHAAERGSDYNPSQSGMRSNDPANSNLGNPQWKEGRGADAGMDRAGGLGGAAGKTSHMHDHQGVAGQDTYAQQDMAGQDFTRQNTYGQQGMAGQGMAGQGMAGQNMAGETTYGQTHPSSTQQFQAQQGRQFQEGGYHQQQEPGSYSHTQDQKSGTASRKDAAYGASQRVEGAAGSAAAGLTGNRQEQERYNQMHEAGKIRQRAAEADRQTRSQAKAAAAGHDDLRSVPRSSLQGDNTAAGMGGMDDLNAGTGSTRHNLRSERRTNIRNDPSAY
ncbi:hypothetical protein CFO_g1370 [Ceratocystis platani]|uniref:CsbD-like protein n=1 Tax=Ceratocystis fimbriata f. sp. platani TaxID=88771 RepID=A0A0F8B3Q5_CERFI|nr:hypothetical protein CFO_g1370 [Ceratocystis platani]